MTELGFTVNIGVSSNKLLAIMAGELEKPDRVHSLFPEEIPQKLWPLPVRELYLVGPATERKLRRMGISTIGQLAAADPRQLRRHLGKQGEVLWHSANGRWAGPVARNRRKTRATATPSPYLKMCWIGRPPAKFCSVCAKR